MTDKTGKAGMAAGETDDPNAGITRLQKKQACKK
jgi:hypothetical protein